MVGLTSASVSPAVPRLHVCIPAGPDQPELPGDLDSAVVVSDLGVAAVATAHPGEDVVVLEAGVRLSSAGLRALADAARADTTIASACAIAGRDAATDPVRPKVVAPRAGAVYLRGEILQLVGWPSGMSSGEALAEFARRASARALVHVLADDVALGVPGSREEPAPTDPSPALSRMRRALEIQVEPLSVTIDARALGPRAVGTQVFTLGLAQALARRDDLRVRVLTAFDISAETAASLRETGAELLGYEEAAHEHVPRTHVLHRPEQVFTVDDLFLLRKLGERFVLTQQDLITYRAPLYHRSEDHWRAHRSATRIALAMADRVTFFSQHALDDAVGEDLVQHADAVVVPPGAGQPAPVTPRPPEGLESGEAFLLCLGADYAHKNRPFAIRLLGELRAGHGWKGRLVLAGPHVEHGSSAPDEAAALAAGTVPPGAVRDVGPVAEAERAWLLEHAAAVVYPTLYEGYGLLPHEAAQAGVPCLYAPQAALAEVAGESCATLVPWDAAASAAAAAPLLVRGPAREAHVSALGAATAAPSWDEVGERFAAIYRDAALRSVSPPSWPFWEAAEREASLRRLRDEVGALATPALGGLLSEPVQRGLLRAAGRPLLRRFVLGPMALLGRGGRTPPEH